MTAAQDRFDGMPGDLPAGPKVISVQQPWASAIVFGGKDVENRAWQTSWRGPLFVHVAQRIDYDANRRAVLGDEAFEQINGGDDHPYELRGLIIGVVRLEGCDMGLPGRWAGSRWAVPGMWHWLLAGAQPLVVPVHARGLPGLWQPPDDAVAQLPALAARKESDVV